MATTPFPSVRRYFLLDRGDVAYLKFILEAYEGLATMSTLERNGERTLVVITVQSSSVPDLDGLIAALGKEIPMIETAPPPGPGREGEERYHA